MEQLIETCLMTWQMELESMAGDPDRRDEYEREMIQISAARDDFAKAKIEVRRARFG